MRAKGGPPLSVIFAGKDHDQAAAVRDEARRLGLTPDEARVLGFDLSKGKVDSVNSITARTV